MKCGMVRNYLRHLKIWESPAYVKKQQADKLEDRSMKAHFIGYPKKSLGYYFYFLENHNVLVADMPHS